MVRTEFLFMQGDSDHSEQEQYELYRNILQKFPDKPVTVRLLDIGGDKVPPYLDLPPGINTDLELRGAIAADMFPEMYLGQAKALLRANVHGNLQLLYPMVADLGDLATFRAIVSRARETLREEGVEFNDAGIKEGVMIETPAAVMMAGDYLEEVDFINIWSNDLLQYALAASRGSLAVERRYHILHPALVKLMELIVKAGKRAKKEVCLCGEVASFEEYYPLLLRIGLRSFSVGVAKFADIKCELLQQDIPRDRQMVEEFYKARSREDADRFFSRFIT